MHAYTSDKGLEPSPNQDQYRQRTPTAQNPEVAYLGRVAM
jgi:hypothetical protein